MALSHWKLKNHVIPRWRLLNFSGSLLLINGFMVAWKQEWEIVWYRSLFAHETIEQKKLMKHLLLWRKRDVTNDLRLLDRLRTGACMDEEEPLKSISHNSSSTAFTHIKPHWEPREKEVPNMLSGWFIFDHFKVFPQKGNIFQRPLYIWRATSRYSSSLLSFPYFKKEKKKERISSWEVGNY